MDFSIIVPVYKEQSIINNCIDHLRSVFQATDFQIIVVDGEEVASTFKEIKNENVIKIKAGCGRAVQMNAGADKAAGKVLVFVHCDTFLPQNAPSLIENSLSGQIKAGAFNIRIDSSKYILRLISVTASLRSRITGHPYGDQVHFFDRDYFFKLGKYKEIPIMEDIEIMQRITRRGDRVKIVNKPVLTSDRRWLKDGVIYTLFRNPILAFLYYTGVSPQKLKKYYSVHSDKQDAKML